MTLREVPDELHGWLKRQAEVHHRSVNREVIVLLEKLREKSHGTAESSADERFTAMMEISRRCAALPELDPRSADEIIGYDENGIPT
jgi:antitoxin VapB